MIFVCIDDYCNHMMNYQKKIIYLTLLQELDPLSDLTKSWSYDLVSGTLKILSHYVS